MKATLKVRHTWLAGSMYLIAIPPEADARTLYRRRVSPRKRNQSTMVSSPPPEFVSRDLA